MRHSAGIATKLHTRAVVPRRTVLVWLLVLDKTPMLAFHVCQPAIGRTVGTIPRRLRLKKKRKTRDWCITEEMAHSRSEFVLIFSLSKLGQQSKSLFWYLYMQSVPLRALCLKNRPIQ